MSSVSKFLENELDRINQILSMAEANLLIINEICDTKADKITKKLSSTDKKTIDFLEKILPTIESNIEESKKKIDEFKDFYYKLF